MTSDTEAPSRQLLARDADGLMLNQRRFLQELAQVSNWKKACDNAEVNQNTARAWLSRDVAFQTAYQTVLGPSVDVARDLMQSHALQAQAMFGEAITAMKEVTQEVTCPCECAHTFTIEAALPDWSARLKAGDTIMKSAKILKDVKEISGTIGVLNMEQQLALARAMWLKSENLPLDLPPNMMQKIAPYLEGVPA